MNDCVYDGERHLKNLILVLWSLGSDGTPSACCHSGQLHSRAFSEVILAAPTDCHVIRSKAWGQAAWIS